MGYIAGADAARQAQIEAQGHDIIQEHGMLYLLKAAIAHEVDGCGYQQTYTDLRL